MSTITFAKRYPWMAAAVLLVAFLLVFAVGVMRSLGQTGTSLVADAGLDQTIPRFETGTLDASGSHDLNGSQISYAWALVAAPANSGLPSDPNDGLSDPTALRPTFTPDRHGEYTFELTITKGVETATDEVIVATRKSRPVADMGDNIAVNVGEQIWLDPTGSFDDDGRRVAYGEPFFVSTPAGSNAAIGNRRFTVDVAGDYVVGLIVRNQNQDSEVDTIVVSTGNVAPTAEAGREAGAQVNDVVTLDGSGSRDPNGDVLTYAWSFASVPAGSAVAFDDAASVTPSFTVDVAGDYVAQLIVTDAAGERVGDTVVITTNNARPVADAGADERLSDGATTTLDGSGSADGDGTTVNFLWTVAHQGNSMSIVGQTTANPDVTVSGTSLHVVQLVVDDGVLKSRPDLVVLPARDYRPSAVIAAPSSADAGDVIALDAASSIDTNSNGLTYSWAIVSAPAGSTASIADPAAAATTFTADVAGSYVVQLIVRDAVREEFISSATTALISVDAVNQPPAFTSSPVLVAGVGAAYSYDSNADDPEGQSVTYSLDAFPAGMTIDSGSGLVSWVPDTAAAFDVTIRATDMLGAFATQSYQIDVSGVAVNQPPVLDPIGPLSVDLGSILSITLAGNDPNGDDLSFMVTPLPLPEGATLNGATGEFIFQPEADQVGSFDLTFSVSDGVLTDEEQVTITVNGPQPGGETSISGRVLDTNDFVVSGIETPITGATVTILGSSSVATSNGNGEFTLSNIPAGAQVFDIDATTAQPGPGGVIYASFRESLTIIDGVNNIVERAFFLPRIEAESLTTVDPNSTTIVSNDAAGISISIPPQTAFAADGTLFTGEISISMVPENLAPVSLPDTQAPAMLFTIQPVGVVFSNPIPITFPNIENAPPNTVMEIFSLDPNTGVFNVVGLGQVSPDGQNVETIAGGVRAADWHFPQLPPLEPNPSPDNPDPDNMDPDMCDDCDSGSSTAIGSGALSISHQTVSYRSVNQSRALKFNYNSELAGPKPIISTNVTIQASGGVVTGGAFVQPTTISATGSIGGVTGPEVFTNGVALSGVFNSIRQSVQLDASTLPTGSYPTSLRIQNNFPNSSRAVINTGDVIIGNRRFSPFGAGWGLDGFNSINPITGGDVVLEKGDGGLRRFRQLGTIAGFLQPTPLPGAQLSSLEFAQIIDANADGHQDLAMYMPLDGGTIVIHLGDGNGNFNTITRLVQADIASGFSSSSGVNRVFGTGDFNGDGVLDVVLANLSGSDIGLEIHLGVGSGFFERTRTYEDPFQGEDIAVGDINRDGFDDILFTHRVSTFDNQLSVIFGSDAGFGEPTPLDPAFTDINDVVVADFNNDGFPDVAALEVEGVSGGEIQLFINTPTGLVRQGAGGNAVTDHMVGDVDGDGFLDIIASNDFSDDLFINYGTGGNGNFVDIRYNNVGTDGISVFQVADLGNDGRDEIIFTEDRNSNQRTGVLAASINSDRTLASVTQQTVGEEDLSFALIGDFNEDGTVDLMTFDDPFGDPPIQATRLGEEALSSTAFVSPRGDFSTLIRNGDSTFTRMLRNKTVEQYNVDGLLVSKSTRNGNETTYGYNGSQQLVSITDPVGLETSLEYVNGSLSSVIDPAGRVTNFSIDAAGDLTSITDPDGTGRQFSYSDSHRLLSQISERGFVTTYEYNEFDRHIGSVWPDGSIRAVGSVQTNALAVGTVADPAPAFPVLAAVGQFTDGNGAVRSSRVNSMGSAIEVIDRLGNTTAIDRDEDNNVVRTVRPNGVAVEFEYDTNGNRTRVTENPGSANVQETRIQFDPDSGNPSQITNPSGNVTSITYDPSGNPTAITNPLGDTFSATYNTRGQALVVTDESGDTTTFSYDTNGNIASITNAMNEIIEFTRDNAGNILTMTEAAGTTDARTTTFVYDQFNRVVSLTNGLDEEYQSTFDAAGNLIQQLDPTGSVTLRSFDSRNRLISLTDPSTGVFTLTRDGNGNIIRSVAADGTITNYSYDEENQLTTIEDAVGEITRFEYDQVGNQTRVISANTGVTDLSFDEFGQITSVTNPLGQTRSITYDRMGEVTQISNPSGEVISMEYDEFSRRTRLATADNVINFGYDETGNLTLASDNDSSITYSYDAADRVVGAELAGAASPVLTLSFQYNNAGDRIQVADSAGGMVNFTRDLAGRISLITTPRGNAIGMAFDAAGRQTRIDFPNSIEMTKAYGSGGRLLDLALVQAGVDLERFQYEYNSVGAITRITELNESRDFAYDNILQLIGVSSTVNDNETFEYSVLGNRNTSHLSTVHAANDNNQLLSDEQFDYSYDLNGNLTSKTSLATGEVTNFSYDGLDQLVSVNLPDGTAISYAYDAFGRRIEKNVDGDITRFAYNADGNDSIHLEVDGTNQPIVRYVYSDLIDQPIAMERAGQEFYFHADHQGSIRKISDESGVIVNEYDYDSFGRFLTKIETVENRFGFTGREFDTESELYYYRARYYDPQSGRFTSEDPNGFGGGDANLYRYVFNSSVNLTDPTGQIVPIAVAAGIGGRIAIGVIGREVGRQIARQAARSAAQRLAQQAARDAAAAAAATMTADDSTPNTDGETDSDSRDRTSSDDDSSNCGDNGGGDDGDGSESDEDGNKGRPNDISEDSPPEDIQRALDEIEAGQDRPNVRNPDEFLNDGRQGGERLPEFDSSGNQIEYTEHTVNPRPPGGTLDGNRVVTGTDGSVRYTVDHYRTFTRIR